MIARPWLDALARRLGVVGAFHDLGGVERRAPDATREALVAAMGLACATEAQAERSLAALEREERERLLEPVRVWREHAASEPALLLRAPSRGTLSGRIHLHEEGGAVHERGLSVFAPRAGHTLSVPLPARPPLGYHRVRMEIDGGAALEQLWIVVPRTAPTARELLGGERAFGVATNLYSVRGRESFGFGDAGDLECLARRVGEAGGDFVLLSPLHALGNRGDSISPYSPVSRRWRNLLYVDVLRVPELAACAAARARLASAEDLLRRLRGADRIDYEAVLELKLDLLRELHRAFCERERGRTTPRGEAYARFLEEGGLDLDDFATFGALREHFARDPERGVDWRRWPEPFQDPRSAAVGAFREERTEAVDLRRWVQFELDRQLSRAAGAARETGMRVGLVGDLAVGSPPDSADAWAHAGVHARGVSLGAPPDSFTADGQDWGLAPLDPHRMGADRYRLWTQLLRTAFRHSGGLRIDHAIGLVRSFWIPAGRPGSEGAYVLQPTDDLIGILALEARRAGALAIGEDLGNVPAGLARTLASWGVLSTAVLLFERDGDRFRAPQRYSPRAMVTATTHDLVPLAGFVAAEDLELRRKLGAIGAQDLERERETRRREVAGLARALRDAGIGAGEPDEKAVSAAAVHRFLARTPAPLLALSLDDLAGEREPVNLPGVSVDRHRSWSRRMSTPLEEIAIDGSELAGRARTGAGRKRDGAHDVAR